MKGNSNMEYGIYKGEVCGRDGCNGIIQEREIDGCCSCHISSPCSYCETPKEFCPECGWDANEEMNAYFEKNKKRYPPANFVYKTPQQKFDELPDGKFGAVIWGYFGTGMVVKGKHPNMGRQEILQRLGCADKYSMASFKDYSETEFMVSYFTD